MAATPAKSIICPACSFKNASNATRCVSCGATMDLRLTSGHARKDAHGRYPGQMGFSVIWALISFVVLGVLTGALVVGLPMVVTALDFEGSYGMAVSIPVWFVGGLLIGMISPGRTFIEPVVAALFVATPTAIYLWAYETVRTLPAFMYAIMALIGVMFTLVGAYFGERIQMGPPPKPAD